MSDSQQQPAEDREALRRQFFESLSILASLEGAEEALEYIQEELEDLLAKGQAEQLLKQGWTGEDLCQ